MAFGLRSLGDQLVSGIMVSLGPQISRVQLAVGRVVSLLGLSDARRDRLNSLDVPARLGRVGVVDEPLLPLRGEPFGLKSSVQT